MQVVSVNVGLPREVEWRSRQVRTGIYKEPVTGRVAVGPLNLNGDAQADLSVHGGVDKAVYAYPAEHYDYWQRERPGQELPFGMFGENLTTAGLSEQDVHVGDRFRIGSSEMVVTQPRLPCYKLGIRFADPGIVAKFLESRRTGFYFAVEKAGEVGAGDVVERLNTDARQVSIADFVRLYATGEAQPELLERLLQIDVLPESWREYFTRRFGD
ncbi:MOSC domain-containing protein [Gloeobacter morelensis]|uniref:MOSC domain-containing protein n=1 Tax=Gloeobacter morelensis MG652769 TaxID=2781736 RepID=A0ABY3PJT1_9CYAN|nr:MOSC domain-containing protein [Gloeobacter morelensis]UFP93881.1 MOSC domain-containing protein [Gloeobacter morelensis MG652769]